MTAWCIYCGAEIEVTVKGPALELGRVTYNSKHNCLAVVGNFDWVYDFEIAKTQAELVLLKLQLL